MKADLHVHSTYSDGSKSLHEVLQEAKSNNVTHISFVDHDTTAGVQAAQVLGKDYGVTVIPGIEISAYDYKRNRKVHILGYNFHPETVCIKQLCTPLLKRRHCHTLWQIDQIIRAGYLLDIPLMLEAAKPSHTLYKQHIMQQLTSSPYTSDEYQALYRKLFKNSGVATGDIQYIDAFDAVKAIVRDGGIAVVAHPGQLDSFDIIPELVEVGLGGIERNHMDHEQADIAKVEALAEQYQLIMTGGTDYHGLFGTSISVGNITSPVNQLLNKFELS